MNKTRVEYVDYVRGLCVMWVVWFHTIHPDFVGFGIRMPLFFFASGIFFKPYPIAKFVSKKLNQLIVPFAFFYILYYAYYVASILLSSHSMSAVNYASILEIFRPYVGNGGFTINPPLWFILALLNLQIMLYCLARWVKSKPLLMLIAVALTLSGVCYFFHVPTYFMFGRALTYMVYFAAGYVCGKILIRIIEQSEQSSIQVCAVASVTVAVTSVVARRIESFSPLLHWAVETVMMMGIIVCAIILFKWLYRVPILHPLKFYGMNSYIVFGMHEMYSTAYRVILEHCFGTITISLGIVQTVLTLLTLWPTILLFNRYIPRLVGKKDLLPLWKNG